MKRTRDDLVGIKLCRITRLRQDDGGIKRMGAASRAVGDKVEVVKAIRLCGKIGRRSRVLSREDKAALGGKAGLPVWLRIALPVLAVVVGIAVVGLTWAEQTTSWACG